MGTLKTYLHRGYALLSMTHATEGLCHTCERMSAWSVVRGYYRCGYCGQDPVEKKIT